MTFKGFIYRHRLTVLVTSLVFVVSCTTYAERLTADVDGTPGAYAGNAASSVTEENRFDRNNYHQSLLREDMRAMTISVRKLLVLDSQAGISAEERHKQVLRELDKLESIATMIEEDGELTSYSLVSPYIGAFLHDVYLARENAEKSAPDYQPATWLIRSCLSCHQNI